MTKVKCIFCDKELRKDKALLDARWEEFKGKFLCRDCAKAIAIMVLDDY